MIHIATVHYETDKWIDLQLSYFERYIKQEYRVYAFLSGEAAKHKDKFYFCCCEPIKEHAYKLNVLGNIICLVANPDDVIIFIDGDAFPIAPLDDYISSTLKEYPLAAIQRLENLGDCQPHPSFCFTTVKFWEEIGGDWKSGYEWLDSKGTNITDVGGNLLGILRSYHKEWKPMLRTNSLDIHPVLFGTYSSIIYHHGSGFRYACSRYDLFSQKTTYKVGTRVLIFRIIKRILPEKFIPSYIHTFNVIKDIDNINKRVSDKIYSYIKGEKPSTTFFQ